MVDPRPSCHIARRLLTKSSESTNLARQTACRVPADPNISTTGRLESATKNREHTTSKTHRRTFSCETAGRWQHGNNTPSSREDQTLGNFEQSQRFFFLSLVGPVSSPVVLLSVGSRAFRVASTLSRARHTMFSSKVTDSHVAMSAQGNGPSKTLRHAMRQQQQQHACLAVLFNAYKPSSSRDKLEAPYRRGLSSPPDSFTPTHHRTEPSRHARTEKGIETPKNISRGTGLSPRT